MKKALLVLLALGAIGAGIGFYMFNKPLTSTQSMKTDYNLQSDALLTAFEENEDEANAKYLDKVIEMTGTIDKVEIKDEKTSIYIATDNPLSSVIFQLEQPSEGLSKGQVVTLKGICTGYLMDVVLVRAVIVEK
jgi:hypothetical protein